MNRIRQLRKIKNMNQVDLCNKLNISQSALSQWENGGNITAKSIDGLCSVFQVSADYLLGLTDDAEAEEDVSRIAKSGNLLSHAKDMSDDQLDIVIDLLSEPKDIFKIKTDIISLLNNANIDDLNMVKNIAALIANKNRRKKDGQK